MRITHIGVTALSGLVVDADLDMDDTYQVGSLATPASDEALRKGNKDITNAEIADAAAIAISKIVTTYLLPTIMTTRGDMVYRDSSNPGRIPKGTAGKVLTMGANDPGWSDLPLLLNNLLFPVLYEEAPMPSRTIGYTAGDSERLAHSIKHPDAITIRKVAILSNGVSGTPPNDIVCRIETDNGGEPSGTPVTNGVSDYIAQGAFTNGVMIWFSFATPPTLTANTLYWIVFQTTETSSANYYKAYGWDGLPTNGGGSWGVGTVGKKQVSGTWSAAEPPITIILGGRV